MSRSYNHSDVYNVIHNNSLKKIFNRKFRHTYKRNLDMPSGGYYRKLNNNYYNIDDYKVYYPEYEFMKDHNIDFDTSKEAKSYYKAKYRSK